MLKLRNKWTGLTYGLSAPLNQTFTTSLSHKLTFCSWFVQQTDTQSHCSGWIVCNSLHADSCLPCWNTSVCPQWTRIYIGVERMATKKWALIPKHLQARLKSVAVNKKTCLVEKGFTVTGFLDYLQILNFTLNQQLETWTQLGLPTVQWCQTHITNLFWNT